MPRPAFRGFVAKQRNRQHNDTDIGVLMNLRLHSHCLHSLTGAQCTPPTPLGMRTCAACNALGNRAVEDETHFVLKCPVYKGERETMLERLRSIYPKFDDQWNISNDIQKMRILLWSIPDETAPWRPRDGTQSTARTQAAGHRSSAPIPRCCRQAASNYAQPDVRARARSVNSSSLAAHACE